MRGFHCSLLFCRFGNGLWVLGFDLEDCYDAMESMVLVRVDSSKQSMHSITMFECFERENLERFKNTWLVGGPQKGMIPVPTLRRKVENQPYRKGPRKSLRTRR